MIAPYLTCLGSSLDRRLRRESRTEWGSQASRAVGEVSREADDERAGLLAYWRKPCVRHLFGRLVGCQLRRQLVDPRLPTVGHGSPQMSAVCTDQEVSGQGEVSGPMTQALAGEGVEAPSAIEPDYADL